MIGNAGTVNSGAIDPLDALADLCATEGLWFHVDGAFGALARLSERLREQVRGIERADSLAFDLHKWMYQPFDVACVLVREGRQLLDTFASPASYVTVFDRGVIAGGLPFADRGFDMSRSFRALKVWMSLVAEGVEAFARQIEQDVEHARLLGQRIAAEDELELLAPVELNIVCFRYRAGADRNEAINREIMLRIQESGEAVFSSTTLNGQFALRCALVNHRRRREDLDRLLDAVLRHGRRSWLRPGDWGPQQSCT
ncbi:MAG: hypothetical protein HC927_08940 [Deltaproteobacteria bacterium]|nr:hypothetical protein [Deltaproteobacteria bacterium]